MTRSRSIHALPALVLGALLLAGCVGPTATDAPTGPEVAGADADAPEEAAPGVEPEAAESGADAPSSPPAEDAAAPAAPAADPPPPVAYRNFPPGSLYELLAAELALRRGDYAEARRRYVEQARATRDPAVIAQAGRLAMYAGQPEDALDVTLLWAEVSPDDPAARQAAAIALINAGRFEAGFEQLVALRAIAGEASFGYLAVHADELDADGRAALLRALDAMAQRHPADAQIAFARAVLHERADAPDRALAVLEAVPAEGLGADAVLLQARLLEGQGRSDAALAVLQAAMERGGRVARLRYMAARLLIEAGRLDAARVQFEHLLERVGENAEILLSLGLIALEQDDLPAARDYLERLLRTGRRTSAARFHLGDVARRREDPASALEHYRHVEPGYDYGNAQSRAAALIMGPAMTGADPVAALRTYMDAQREAHPEVAVELWLVESEALMNAGRPAAAAAVLDAAVAAHPEDTELLFTRALARERAEDLAGMEADLRRILSLDPDDAPTLNTLGYVLADRGVRLDEARSLIRRALAIRPEDPAYIDSLGWVEYRLGNYDRAVALLRRAYAAFPDHEVAAHLGEALWMQGQRDAAREVWREALARDPDSPILAETLRRLLGAAADVRPVGATP